MMAPEVYAQFRADAGIHLQLLQTGSPRAGRGSGRVQGRVVRIFRNRDHAVHWGQRIDFSVPVIDRSATPAPGGTIYLDGEAVGRARWIEAFLESWEGRIHLVYSQLLVIAHPTLRPVCGPDVRGFLP